MNETSRERLSKERIVAAALDIADRQGLEALSMRRLSERLGAKPMSLYNHVANKRALLASMADAVLAEVEAPSPSEDWADSLRRSAMSFHHALVRHTWAATLFFQGGTASPARLHYMEGVLATLREAGFSTDVTDHAYHTLESHIFGFSMWISQVNIDPETMAARASAFLSEFPTEEFPYVAEHIEHHAKARVTSADADFSFGLELILKGLDSMRG